MTVEPVFFWNLLLTLVIAPAVFIFRALQQEVKRIDILLNQTREDMANDYVTKKELSDGMERVFDTLDKIEEKLDKLFEVK